MVDELYHSIMPPCPSKKTLLNAELQHKPFRTCTPLLGAQPRMCPASACACCQPLGVRWESGVLIPALWKPSPWRMKWMTLVYEIGIKLSWGSYLGGRWSKPCAGDAPIAPASGNGR